MQDDTEAVRAVIKRWHERTAQGDVAGVLSLMTEDATFLVAGKPAMSGKPAFERGLRTVLTQGRIQSSAEVKEVLVSGDLAFAICELSVRVVPNDGSAPASRHGPALTVFCRSSNGTWLLKRDANLLVSDSA